MMMVMMITMKVGVIMIMNDNNLKVKRMMLTMLMTLLMTMMMIDLRMMTLEESASSKRKSQLVQSSMAKPPSRSLRDDDNGGGDGDGDGDSDYFYHNFDKS